MHLQFIYRLALFLSLTIAVMVIGNLGTVVACCIARVRMTKIGFFVGKPLFTFASPLCPICIGYNPLGCYVQMDAAKTRRPWTIATVRIVSSVTSVIRARTMSQNVTNTVVFILGSILF